MDHSKSGFKQRILGKKSDYFLSKFIQQNMSASFVQKVEAKKKTYNNPELSSLPTMNVLRMLKYL